MPAIPRLAVAVTLGALIGALMVAGTSQGAARVRFSSCGELRSVFPTGVAASAVAATRAVRNGLARPVVRPAVYAAARVRLDKDRDGLMCGVRRGMPPASPVPTASPSAPVSETYLAPTVSGEVTDTCRIRDRSEESLRFGNVFAGFPTRSEPVHRAGTLRVALVPIEWSDVPGQPDPLKRVAAQMDLFTNWYQSVSGGRVTVEWVTYDGWARMPKPSAEYVITATEYAGGQRGKFELGRDALAAADPHVNFTDVDFVHFLLPRGHRVLDIAMQVFPWEAGGGFMTNEGRVGGYTAAGLHFDHPMRSYWEYWAHEVGHFLRIAHVGSSWEWSDMHGYDLMGSQDGPFRTLSSWLRFMKGWLPDDQVHCMTRETLRSTQIMLAPLDSTREGIKSALVRLNDEQILVVESRRPTSFDCTSTFPNRGVLAYVYDSRFGNQEVFFTPVYPSERTPRSTECMSPEMVDVLLKPGDAVQHSGVAVRVTRTDDYDTVVIEPVR